MEIKFWHLLLVAIILSNILYISLPDTTLIKSIETTGVIFFTIGIILIIITLLNVTILNTSNEE